MKIEYEINKKTLKNLVIKLLKMRNIILMFLLLFILTINAYAIKEIDIKGITIPDKTNFTNTKLYIPKKVKINNHTLQVFKPSNGILINKLPDLLQNLGNKKIKDLLKNDLLIVGNDTKLEMFKEQNVNDNFGDSFRSWNIRDIENSIVIDKNEILTFYNKFAFDATIQNYDSIIKWYPINPEMGNWYTSNIKNDYPKVIIFDEILLPQNITGYFFYAKNISDDGNYIKWGEQVLNIIKKYEIVYTKGLSESKNIIYIIVPYYEINIPFSKAKLQDSEPNIFYLTYDIIEDIYFKSYNTNIQLYNNGTYNSLFEFISY